MSSTVEHTIDDKFLDLIDTYELDVETSNFIDYNKDGTCIVNSSYLDKGNGDDVIATLRELNNAGYKGEEVSKVRVNGTEESKDGLAKKIDSLLLKGDGEVKVPSGLAKGMAGVIDKGIPGMISLSAGIAMGYFGGEAFGTMSSGPLLLLGSEFLTDVAARGIPAVAAGLGTYMIFKGVCSDIGEYVANTISHDVTNLALHIKDQ